MERLKERFDDARKALKAFEAIFKEPYSMIVRDAAIQRFEFTFEAVWKFCKEYLKVREGLIAASPKTVFRELGVLGKLNEEEVVQCLEMTDHRNDTSHTYKEEVAKIIFDSLPKYQKLMAKIINDLAE